MILNMICNDGNMFPSDFMLSLPIVCLSVQIYITLVLQGIDSHSSIWVPLNCKWHPAYFPIYFNDGPVDLITNLMETSTIFDIHLACQDITPCEEDIDMINPQSIVDTPSLDPHKCPMIPQVPHKNYLIPKVPGCSTWEQIKGLSNNEDTDPLDHESSEGSSNQDYNAVKIGSQHRQPPSARNTTWGLHDDATIS